VSPVCRSISSRRTGERLSQATAWLRSQPVGELPIGYFGASTGAAAALWAAADPDLPVSAIVSRGGRPDLALERLPNVRAPTLLIVGSRELEIVPGATHLFEEPGTLHTVAVLARDWFLTHIPDTGPTR
jgi:putative phosphoribosyl transferase